ncbi:MULTISPECIES: ABC transporter ATP-binding protein [unclassified Caballeronia]|uniref:ABC transporter ATP-binding protein n=1 Tax=unclassified Caballeronia TaxID=2646786 RepID=UPI0028542344|nr:MULTISPECIES: ABC transporter ATP-binding protein [unclassified Caballeronia]MDR5751450.1 ABC transporter ATP-binding protein [Caballeronia sp. LZ024]MDR5844409.1 ABC transporter ATP-binding protein [Caballeronia sp. LZ031]
MSQFAIEINDVGKCYNIYERPRDRLLQMLVGRRRQLYRPFWALQNVSFSVPRGETVGIVGRNGSGKSTLLQIIAGTLTPTAGAVSVNGRVAALLELGSGFNPEFTGRENVYLNASLLGLSPSEVDERFDSIVSFADIGAFVDQPVKTYSSGMMVRLAFAVQAQTNPEILIVDEALAVGDARFQAKCFDRLKQLKDNGTSILLVTHSSEQIVTHCSSAILLDQGQKLQEGAPREVVNRYLDLLFGRDSNARRRSKPSAERVKEGAVSDEESKDAAEDGPDVAAGKLRLDEDVFSQRPGYNPYEYRWGDGSAAITDFRLESGGVEFPHSVEVGARVRLDIGVRFTRTLVRPILGVTIKTKEGITVFGSNSELLDCEEVKHVGEAGERMRATVFLDCRLGQGDYFISLGIATREGETIVPHDRRYDAIHLVISPDTSFFGLVDMKMSMQLHQL